jgi:serine/threonine protein kinase
LLPSRSAYPTSLFPGSIIGAWRLMGRIAQGSSGIVFRAQRADSPEAGLFAFKLALSPENPRFELEEELLSRLHHPNIPRLHDLGEWSGPSGALFPFLVMDFADGLPLYSWAQLQARTADQHLRVLAQAASALQAVHAAGGIHRDVKGGNILVRPSDGHLWLVDFGSCTYRGAPVLTHDPEPPSTRRYQSPQALLHQWRCHGQHALRYPSAPADDIYALGVTAYFLTTESYPVIDEETDANPAHEDGGVHFPALVPAEKLVPLRPELARWIQQMLSVDPAARGTAAELASGLALSADTEAREAAQAAAAHSASEQRDEKQPPSPVRQRKPWRKEPAAAAAAVALIIGGMGLGHALREQSLLTATRDRAREAQAAAQEWDTSAVGETALQQPLTASEPSTTHEGISAEVPKDPMPNQRQPPCKKPQVEINGGCWIGVLDERPPCVESTYEWRRRCYWPVFTSSRPNTTGEK